MKLIFSLFFLIFAKTLFAGDISSEYIIKVKGLTIGTLNWNLEMTDTFYNFTVSLKNKGFLSNIYNFNGNYNSVGSIENGNFIPNKYRQKWQTKNKYREVEIVFVDRKIISLSLLPTEKESPRINIRNLVIIKFAANVSLMQISFWFSISITMIYDKNKLVIHNIKH